MIISIVAECHVPGFSSLVPPPTHGSSSLLLSPPSLQLVCLFTLVATSNKQSDEPNNCLTLYLEQMSLQPQTLNGLYKAGVVGGGAGKLMKLMSEATDVSL